MASTQLTRTTGTPTSTDIGTISFWMKRSAIDLNNMYIISNYVDGSNYGYIRFKAGDQLQAYATSANDEKRTNRLFRDTNAWSHIVLRVDTSQSTASDRVRMYINGVQETSFSTETNCSQNADYDLFKASASMRIGSIQSGTMTYFDGCLSHFHYCDGQSYAPTEFGETDSTTGIWTIKTSPSVTYGNNGFFILKDGNNLSGSTVQDQSGQGNNFTASGNLTSLKDCPDNVFCNNNRLWSQESTRKLNLSNISNTLSGAGSATWYQVPGTLAFSKGKYYWECKFNASTNLDKNTPGVIDVEKTQESGQFQDKTGSVFYKNEDGGETRIDGSTSTSDYGTLAQNDILGVAVDMDASTPTVKFYKNGSLLVTANASSLSGKFVTPAQSVYTSGEYQVNYGNGYFGTTAVTSAQNPDDGNGIFEYDVPTGYRALCTKSINAEEYS